MPKLTIVHLKQCSIFQQLQIEEALLRTGQDNYCLINEGNPFPAIVLGISSKIPELINLDKWRQNPVDLIRRFSGGGTVFVDENTYFISIICNAACSATVCTPKEVLNWNGQLYASGLVQHGFSIQENDFVLGNKKFAGNAQYLVKGRWLHHTSFLWDYDPQNMKYLLLPQKTPSYRQQRSHDDFLCRLKDYLPRKEALKEMIRESLAEKFTLEEREAIPHDFAEILAKPHRKATTLIKNC